MKKNPPPFSSTYLMILTSLLRVRRLTFLKTLFIENLLEITEIYSNSLLKKIRESNVFTIYRITKYLFHFNKSKFFIFEKMHRNLLCISSEKLRENKEIIDFCSSEKFIEIWKVFFWKLREKKECIKPCMYHSMVISDLFPH